MEEILGQKLVVKATEIQEGDFLVGDGGLSTSEVTEVQVLSDVILVNLAVKGIARLDPAWDVAVFRGRQHSQMSRSDFDYQLEYPDSERHKEG